MNQSRINRIIENMKSENIGQIVITAPNSLYYLLDEMFHPGERMLALYLNDNGEAKLIINELFPIDKDLGVDLVFYNDTEDPIEYLKNLVDEEKVFGVDKEWPSHFLVKLMKKIPSLKIEIGSICVDAARMRKDEDEISKMREASKVNDRTMARVLEVLKEKKYSEVELKKYIPSLFAKENTFEASFSPLICYGENSAIPHHDSGDKMPEDNGAILIDMGGRTNGYCSDMTRSFFYGEPPAEYVKIYELVRKANLAGITAVKHGCKIKDVDDATRKVISDAGYGEFFTHRTGHGIGIEVHEYPDVNSINEMILEVGMTFSIEPGIYLPNKYGVRIEDIVLVTEDGCEVLNDYPKELQLV